MNTQIPESGSQEGDFLRPGVHPHPASADLALVVIGEQGEYRILPRTCPHGTEDLVLVGLVNTTTGEFQCSHALDRWQIA